MGTETMTIIATTRPHGGGTNEVGAGGVGGGGGLDDTPCQDDGDKTTHLFRMKGISRQV